MSQIKLTSFTEDTKEMRLERLKAERAIFESQRPERIAKLIESAKAQTETPQFKKETRLVEYAEKFYPKYCGVTLTREQINEMRMMWKQIWIDEANGFYDDDDPEVNPYLMRFDELPKRKEIKICADCYVAMWQGFEDNFDFYMMEDNVNNGQLIGGRNSQGKEMLIHVKEDFYKYANEKCQCGHQCHEAFTDGHYGNVEHVMVIDPIIKDELPEPLRAQKYLSEESGVKLSLDKNLNKLQPENVEKFGISYDKDPRKVSWKVRILSNGYGKDSVTEIALNHAYYDEIVFSDTGSEQPETYAYIKYLSTKLPIVARNKIRIVHSRYGIIYDYYYNKKIQPIPARRDCTGKFKVEPMKQVLTKVYGINPMGFKREIIEVKDGVRIYDHKIEMSIGINYSEPDRMNGGGVWYMKNRYPLVEKKVEKKDEKGILEALGYIVPVKSGCFFCPYGTQPYWKGLKRDHPELYEKAKAMQDNSTLKQKFIKFKDTDKTNVELSCSCFNGNWETKDEELDTKNNWSF